MKIKNLFESCLVYRNCALLQGVFVERVNEWKKQRFHSTNWNLKFSMCVNFFGSTVNIQYLTSVGLLTLWKSQSWGEYKLSGNWTTLKILSETNKINGNGVFSYFRQRKSAFLVPIDETSNISAALKFNRKN